LKQRYYTTVEFIDRYGKANRELSVYCDLGQKPTIGDFLEAFRCAGMEMDITDFARMIFKPKDPARSPIISLRVIRTYQDYLHKPAAV
jgi:hypothetical protein